MQMNLFPPNQRLKAIPVALKNEINSHRLGLSSFFNGAGNGFGAACFANEGTGFGKSYNVIREFIINTPHGPAANGHRNLLFMSPQKAQIRIDHDIVEMARDRGILFLSFLSRSDLSDLDYEGWVSKTKKESENEAKKSKAPTNEKLYKRWAKNLRKAFPEQAGRLDALVLYLRNLVNQEERLSLILADEIVLERLREDIKRSEWDLLSALTALVTAIVEENQNGQYISLDERFSKTESEKDKTIIEVIDHLLPLERARRMPTILLATSKRFLYSTNIVKHRKDGKPYISSRDFDVLIGKKMPPTNSKDESTRAGSVNGKPFAEQVKFLQDHWFKVDDKNPFLMGGVDFTVVVDEEHVAYNLFADSAHKKLITAKIQVHHVLAALYRLVKPIQVVDGEDVDDIVLYESRKQLWDDLSQRYEKSCNSSVPLNTILGMCERNLGHIAIDTTQVEQILSITKNIFAMSAKRFYAEEQLKQIRIREQVSGSELLIYKQSDDLDANPSLYDVLQVLMTVLAACAGISDQNLLGLVKTGDGASQNSLLYDFIFQAREHRSYINSVFDRATDSDISIDAYYTYIMPKLVFSLETVKKLQFDPGTKHKRIYVSLLLDLFLELPEVILMRLLHGTGNSAMCLSATTGFKQSYSGSFNRDMLRTYGAALDFKVVERSDSDRQVMADLRDARQKARDLQIRTFHDTAKNMISDLNASPDLKMACRNWDELLKPHFYSQNRYHLSALGRQIEAMLLAAWDGRHSMILSLNNKFQECFRQLLKENKNGRFRGQEAKCDNMVIDFQPFPGRPKVRAILFNAELAKHPGFQKSLEVDNDTKIAFISSYNSAGTGLNLVIKDTVLDIEEDFERLVLINTPYYTEVLTEEGLNTLQNHILMLKYHAANAYTKLSDLDTNLMQSHNRKVLMNEHRLSQMKVIIQAVGRIERRDFHTTSEIIMPDDVLDSLIVGYTHLLRSGNDLMLDSLSLLNHRVMEFCLASANARSFASDEEREDFQRTSVQSGKMIDGFFEKDFRSLVLQKARSGDMQAAKLNELLRSIKSITAPLEYVKALLKHPIIAASPYFKDVIDRFYFWEECHSGVTLCTMSDERFGITDLSDGLEPYQPHLWLVPEYLRATLGTKNMAYDVIRKAAGLDTALLEKNPPNPALLPLLKGNVGEYLFSECLKKLSIQPLSIAEQYEILSPEVYERFDIYLLFGTRLICIDVKNWSASLDKEDMSRDLLTRAAEKREQLTTLCKDRGLEPEFVYVNTRHDRNALNDLPEYTSGSPIRYMNLFKKISEYRANAGSSTQLFALSDDYCINPQLLNILQEIA